MPSEKLTRYNYDEDGDMYPDACGTFVSVADLKGWLLRARKTAIIEDWSRGAALANVLVALGEEYPPDPLLAPDEGKEES